MSLLYAGSGVEPQTPHVFIRLTQKKKKTYFSFVVEHDSWKHLVPPLRRRSTVVFMFLLYSRFFLKQILMETVLNRIKNFKCRVVCILEGNWIIVILNIAY